MDFCFLNIIKCLAVLLLDILEKSVIPGGKCFCFNLQISSAVSTTFTAADQDVICMLRELI